MKSLNRKLWTELTSADLREVKRSASCLYGKKKPLASRARSDK